MLDQVLSLLDSTGTLVTVIGVFAVFMRAAGTWSETRTRAIVIGVIAALVTTLFVGGSWAQDALQDCATLRERFSIAPTAEGRAELAECWEQNAQTELSHELAFFVLMAVGGAVGYFRSSYHRGMSFDRALEIAQGIGDAMVANEKIPYSWKQCREAEAVLAQLPLQTEYLSAMKTGVMIARMGGI